MLCERTAPWVRDFLGEYECKKSKSDFISYFLVTYPTLGFLLTSQVHSIHCTLVLASLGFCLASLLTSVVLKKRFLGSWFSLHGKQRDLEAIWRPHYQLSFWKYLLGPFYEYINDVSDNQVLSPGLQIHGKHYACNNAHKMASIYQLTLGYRC